MGATLTTATNILKEIYEPRIREQLQNETKTSKRIEQTSDGVSSQAGGKYVVFTIHTKRNQGIGARLEMELLPDAGNQSYQQARIGLSYQYGAVRLSGQSMELANSDFQSFASILDEEMNGIKRDLAKDYNRQIYGTSVGALGTATGAYTTVTIPMTNTQYMEVGQIVDVYDSTGVTQRATGRVVQSVSKNTNVVLDGANIAAGASGDIVVRKGSLNREIVGLSQIVDDTAPLFNIDPATQPLWKSVINSNGGTPRPLSESLMIKHADDIQSNNGGNTTVIFTTLGVRRSYFNLLVQQRRYTDTKEFGGGFKGLAFTTDDGDIPLMTDLDCQPNRMYFLNEKELKLYREKDWSFMDRDGSKWQRVVGYDAYDAMLYKYCQLATHRRNTHGMIKDVIES